jgi:F420-non-reducing hydrogenase iron-sulfur subunit
MSERKPQIIAFVCNWCSYAGADQAGGLKLAYPAEIKLIRMMCSGRVDPQFVLAAFREGADGVMILGCHPGDCHYRSGNIKALRRYLLLGKALGQLGVDPRRLRLDWVAAGEGEKFRRVAEEMAAVITELGPLHLLGSVSREVA